MLWSLSNQLSIARLESVCRHFTAKVHGLESFDYWERLAHLQLYSQERRRERYAIIFVWKLAEQLVQGYFVNFVESERRGRLAEIPPMKSKVSSEVKNARENSV